MSRTRWLAFAALTGAGFVVNLDRTMVAVVLPAIGEELGAGGLDGVVTANLVAVAVASPTSGWLAHRFGVRRVLLTAFGLFVVLSLAAAVAPSLSFLVAARALQGAAGGVTMAVGLAGIHALFEAGDRARAFAIQAAVVMISPALGPVFGGALSEVQWRTTFLVAGLAAAVSFGLSWRWLRGVGAGGDVGGDGAGVDGAAPFDRWGFAFGAAGFPLVVIVTTFGGTWGWTSMATAATGLAAVAALAGFAAVEWTARSPLLALTVLRDRLVRMTFVLEWLATIPYQSQFVLLPLALTTLGGASPVEAGLMTTASAIGTVAALRGATRRLQESAVRANVLIGSACLMATSAALAVVVPDGPLLLVAAVMVVHGSGGALCLMPLLVAGLDAVEPAMVPHVSAMRIVNKLLSQAVGVSICVAAVLAIAGQTNLLAAAAADPDGMAAAYAAVNAILVVPAAITFLMAAKDRTLDGGGPPG